MKPVLSHHSCESLYGFKTIDFGNNRKISLIAPDSPSWKAGLSIGDEIISVNGYTLKNDFNDWMNYFKDLDVELSVSSNQQLKVVTLKKDSNKAPYYNTYKLKQKGINTANFKNWILLNS